METNKVLMGHNGCTGLYSNTQFHTRPYTATQDNTGPYGTIHDYKGQSRTILDQMRPHMTLTLRDHLWPYENIDNHAGLQDHMEYGTIQDHKWPYETNCDHMWSYWTIHDKTRPYCHNMWPYRTIENHTGPYLTICDHTKVNVGLKKKNNTRILAIHQFAIRSSTKYILKILP